MGLAPAEPRRSRGAPTSTGFGAPSTTMEGTELRRLVLGDDVAALSNWTTPPAEGSRLEEF